MTQPLPDPDLVEQYTQGECHIFAGASVIWSAIRSGALPGPSVQSRAIPSWMTTIVR